LHEAVAAYYRGHDPSEIIEDDLARVMYEGWVEWIETNGIDAGCQVLAVEEDITAYLGQFDGWHVTLSGRPDLLVKHPNGAVSIRDLKTVASIEQMARQLQVDDQLLTYALLLQLNGYKVAGAEHMLMKRGKRTTPGTWYDIIRVSFNERQLANHARHVRATVREIIKAKQLLEQGADPHDFLYPNPTRDCTWDCPFLAVCPMADDGSDVEAALKALQTLGGGDGHDHDPAVE
jgi:RecB family exonuclease